MPVAHRLHPQARFPRRPWPIREGLREAPVVGCPATALDVVLASTLVSAFFWSTLVVCLGLAGKLASPTFAWLSIPAATLAP